MRAICSPRSIAAACSRPTPAPGRSTSSRSPARGPRSGPSTRCCSASDDPWFRPVDACAAPDGSVFVADWYDAGVGGHAFSDQTTGRIYRVAPKGNKATQVKARLRDASDGLIAALKSPEHRHAGRRPAGPDRAGQTRLHGREVVGPSESDLTYRARATLDSAGRSGIDRDGRPGGVPSVRSDPRIRELAVRMLGRDCRENGQVEYKKPKARKPPAALAHLDALLPLADDPDAGVRRELILAFRNLPTDKVGDALKKLAASWDGQDRWYLEASAWRSRTARASYLSGLFDGTLYGDHGPGQRRAEARSWRCLPISRSIATRRSSPPALPDLPAIGAEQVPRPRPGGSIAARSLPVPGQVACLRSRHPSCKQAADDILEADEGAATAARPG